MVAVQTVVPHSVTARPPQVPAGSIHWAVPATALAMFSKISIRICKLYICSYLTIFSGSIMCPLTTEHFRIFKNVQQKLYLIKLPADKALLQQIFKIFDGEAVFRFSQNCRMHWLNWTFCLPTSNYAVFWLPKIMFLVLHGEFQIHLQLKFFGQNPEKAANLFFS